MTYYYKKKTGGCLQSISKLTEENLVQISRAEYELLRDGVTKAPLFKDVLSPTLEENMNFQDWEKALQQTDLEWDLELEEEEEDGYDS